MVAAAAVSSPDAVALVEESGLAALVYNAGGVTATGEAFDLLGVSGGVGGIADMFGLAPDSADPSPIRRALRSGSFVSDRMVVKDGRGTSRLFEVTSLPAGPETAVILLRELPSGNHKGGAPTPTRLAVRGRAPSRGLTPPASDHERIARERLLR